MQRTRVGMQSSKGTKHAIVQEYKQTYYQVLVSDQPVVQALLAQFRKASGALLYAVSFFLMLAFGCLRWSDMKRSMDPTGKSGDCLRLITTLLEGDLELLVFG